MICHDTARGVGSFLRVIRKKWVGCQQVVILKKQLEGFEKLREETISLKTLLEEERRIG
jgi:hypothetical protein